jgi:hypothetical protein
MWKRTRGKYSAAVEKTEDVKGYSEDKMLEDVMASWGVRLHPQKEAHQFHR